jgi:hypothetical protein
MMVDFVVADGTQEYQKSSVLKASVSINLEERKSLEGLQHTIVPLQPYKNRHGISSLSGPSHVWQTFFCFDKRQVSRARDNESVSGLPIITQNHPTEQAYSTYHFCTLLSLMEMRYIV